MFVGQLYFISDVHSKAAVFKEESLSRVSFGSVSDYGHHFDRILNDYYEPKFPDLHHVIAYDVTSCHIHD